MFLLQELYHDNVICGVHPTKFFNLYQAQLNLLKATVPQNPFYSDPIKLCSQNLTYFHSNYYTIWLKFKKLHHAHCYVTMHICAYTGKKAIMHYIITMHIHAHIISLKEQCNSMEAI